MKTSTVKKEVTQFELSKLVLNNLYKFEVSPGAKIVLLYLSDCYNPKNKTIYPRQQTIAKVTGLSLSTVKRAIKELAEAGVIIYETKSSNYYKFTSKIFDLFKLTLCIGQNDTLRSVNMKPPYIEQKKEQKNNRESFLKNKFTETPQKEASRDCEETKRPYEHFNHINGPIYQPYDSSKVLRRDEKAPMNDKETALNFIFSFTEEELKNQFIKAQVDKVRNKWNL